MMPKKIWLLALVLSLVFPLVFGSLSIPGLGYGMDSIDNFRNWAPCWDSCYLEFSLF